MSDTPSGYTDLDEFDRASKRKIKSQRGADAGLNRKLNGSSSGLAAVQWPSGEPPAREWLVDGLIPIGNVTMLNGDGGVGKSLLALQLLTAAATGRGWIGREVRPCRAIGIFCEDDQPELQRRQADINRLYGIEWGDLDNLTLISRVGHDNALALFDRYTDEMQVQAFTGQIEHLITETGAQLVVVDSLHDFFAGNENSRPQARAFVNLLRQFTMTNSGAVVVTAHPSLTGMSSGSGASGSTAWNNAVRSRLYLTRPAHDETDDTADDNRRVLKTMKANYSSAGQSIKLVWERGVFVDAAAAGGTVDSIERAAADAHADARFLACLDEVTKRQVVVSHAKNAQNYAPKSFVKMIEAERLTQGALAKAMERLFASRKINVGTPFVRANRHAAIGIARASKQSV